MGRNLKAMSIAVGLCVLMALSVSVSAQNRRYSRNRVNTKAEIDRLIRRVENQSDRFVRSFDSSLDNSRLDGTMREDNLNSGPDLSKTILIPCVRNSTARIAIWIRGLRSLVS